VHWKETRYSTAPGTARSTRTTPRAARRQQAIFNVLGICVMSGLLVIVDRGGGGTHGLARASTSNVQCAGHLRQVRPAAAEPAAEPARASTNNFQCAGDLRHVRRLLVIVDRGRRWHLARASTSTVQCAGNLRQVRLAAECLRAAAAAQGHQRVRRIRNRFSTHRRAQSKARFAAQAASGVAIC
jgi:hypothetical protein